MMERIPKSEPEIEVLGQFLAAFNNESDRGAALAAAAFVDERLYEVLEAFFVDQPASRELLCGANAPLATFSARISACYALGLLQGNEYREINIIRKVRNEFGHTWENISFETGRVADLSRQLPWLGPVECETGATVRARFNAAVAILLTDLLWRVRLVRGERRTLREWPNKTRR